MEDLKNRTVRAGMISLGARGFGSIVRILSLMILGRLLDPTDYGLVTMVTAFTGVLNMFGGFGLSQAAIQRNVLSEEESTALFWMNTAFGGLLTLVACASAPIVSAFYHEPRLTPIMVVIAMNFFITGAGIQHGALLQRRMQFGVSATIETISLMIGTAVSIGMALAGYGYWALVSVVITLPLITTVGQWLSTGWIPGRPRMSAEIPSLLRFGGGMTLNGFLSYFATNVDKLLIGRFWGTEAVGLYGRAFHLINFPGDNLNTTIGDVAFAALSRTKDDPARVRRYFLKGYSLVVTLTMPLTILCALFADDIVFVALGPNWANAADIFRILAPTILVFAITKPLGWLLNALGLVRRGVYIAFISAPLMFVVVLVAIPYGPRGVAAAYSAMMLIKLAPLTVWALHGTGIRARDIVHALACPLTASLIAACAALAAHAWYGPVLSPAIRLILDVSAFGSVYLLALLLIAGEQALYLDLFRTARVWPAVQSAADPPVG
jgi:PST family polysaccharide transporter